MTTNKPFKYNKSLLGYDCTRCHGNSEFLLCNICARNCVGNPYRQSVFIAPQTNDPEKCDYHLLVNWHEFLYQWAHDVLKEEE